MGIMEVEVVTLKRVPKKRRGFVFFLCYCYLFFDKARKRKPGYG